MSIKHVTKDNFNELSKGDALLDFWAPWCGPCRAAAPIFEETAGEQGGKVLFGKVNVDEEQALAGEFSVSTIPTFIFLRDGKEIDRLVGLPSKQKLETMLQK